jgi:transcriptional regulator with XRE-family HTH domain
MTRVMKELIRVRRKRMTASEAARKMKVSRQQVHNLESGSSGDPSILTIERYAKAVGAKVVVVESR